MQNNELGLSNERFFQIVNILGAVFQKHEIASLTMLIGHLEKCAVTGDEIIEFAKMYSIAILLDSVGYFNPDFSEKHARRVAAFEKTLPKDIRRIVRKQRLAKNFADLERGVFSSPNRGSRVPGSAGYRIPDRKK